MVRDQNQISNAIVLRKSGSSYLQISQKLGIPKSTLSGWFSKEEWSKKIIAKNIGDNIDRNRNNLILANAARSKKRILRNEDFRLEAKKEFKLLKRNSLFISGISLYWGEGEKTDSGRVSLINTDPAMIQIVADFYRKCLKVANENLRVGLFIYEDHSEALVKKYWSNLLKIPENQFIKTQVLKSRSKLTSRGSKYGICSLYFSSTELSVKIRELIKLLQESTLREQ